MTHNYFNNCYTAEDVKERFKKLAFELHPDNRPDNPEATREFQDMNAEFKAAYNRLKNVHRTKDGETYTETRADHMATDNGERFMEVFYSLMKCDGLILEVCGRWLWITGETYHHKDTIKALGCFFSSSHKAWYFNGETERKRTRKSTDMEIIRQTYGSEISYSTQSKKLLAS